MLNGKIFFALATQSLGSNDALPFLALDQSINRNLATALSIKLIETMSDQVQKTAQEKVRADAALAQVSNLMKTQKDQESHASEMEAGLQAAQDRANQMSTKLTELRSTNDRLKSEFETQDRIFRTQAQIFAGPKATDEEITAFETRLTEAFAQAANDPSIDPQDLLFEIYMDSPSFRSVNQRYTDLRVALTGFPDLETSFRERAKGVFLSMNSEIEALTTEFELKLDQATSQDAGCAPETGRE